VWSGTLKASNNLSLTTAFQTKKRKKKKKKKGGKKRKTKTEKGKN
jgi:hypothetical protein